MPQFITTLKPFEVFVFGSNGTGFHGAGAAGLAMRGDSRNTWREDQEFLMAMNSPPGSMERQGKWAVLGVAQGFQEGREGKSYAIQTVTRPGARRSINLSVILHQLKGLKTFSLQHSGWIFLITRLGEGYAGYSHQEMSNLWNQLKPFPDNWKFIGQDEINPTPLS